MAHVPPLAELIAGAEEIAAVDGRTYARAAIVLELGADVPGGVQFYCPAGAWPHSIAGRIAARDAKIAELEQRLASLGALPAGSAPAAPQLPTPQLQPLAPPQPRRRKMRARDRERARVVCNFCRTTLESNRHRAAHEQVCLDNPNRRTPRNVADAEGMLMCSRCKERKPATREHFYFKTSETPGGAPYIRMPCIACQNAIRAAALAPNVANLQTPCNFCGCVGLKGADAWKSNAQRGAHMACCSRKHGGVRRDATAQPQPRPATRDEDDEPEDPDEHTAGGVSDSTTIYLREIGRAPLLTAEREIELGALRIAGDAAAVELERRRDELDAEQRAELERRVAGGAAARAELVESNLRLVVSIAKKYRSPTRDMLELIQEGNIGLMRSAEKFDPAAGARFSTYAHWSIQQAIHRSLAQHERLVRLPVHVHDALGRIWRAWHPLEQRLGRKPQAADIAAELDMPLKKVEQLLTANVMPKRLDEPLESATGERNRNTLGDVTPDLVTPSPEEHAEQHERRRVAEQLLAQLPERHADVLRQHFGFVDGEPQRYAEIGRAGGFSRERARQMREEAIAMLREHIAAEPRVAEQLAELIA